MPSSYLSAVLHTLRAQLHAPLSLLANTRTVSYMRIIVLLYICNGVHLLELCYRIISEKYVALSTIVVNPHASSISVPELLTRLSSPLNIDAVTREKTGWMNSRSLLAHVVATSHTYQRCSPTWKKYFTTFLKQSGKALIQHCQILIPSSLQNR